MQFACRNKALKTVEEGVGVYILRWWKWVWIFRPYIHTWGGEPGGARRHEGLAEPLPPGTAISGPPTHYKGSLSKLHPCRHPLTRTYLLKVSAQGGQVGTGFTPCECGMRDKGNSFMTEDPIGWAH